MEKKRGHRREERVRSAGARHEEEKDSAKDAAAATASAAALSVIARLNQKVQQQPSTISLPPSSSPAGPAPAASALAPSAAAHPASKPLPSGMAVTTTPSPAPCPSPSTGDGSDGRAPSPTTSGGRAEGEDRGEEGLSVLDAEAQAQREMQKRAERVRAFQEEKRAREAAAAAAAAASAAMGNTKMRLAQAALALTGKVGVTAAKQWSLEDEAEEEVGEEGGKGRTLERAERASTDTPLSMLSVENQASVSRDEEEEEDGDPLDAFMSSLERGGVAEGLGIPEQADMYGAFAAGDGGVGGGTGKGRGGGKGRKGRLDGYDPLGSNTITAAELFGGRSVEKAAWESDTDGDGEEEDGEEGMMEDEEDEEQLEADRQAFLAALRGESTPKPSVGDPVGSAPPKAGLDAEGPESGKGGEGGEGPSKEPRSRLGRLFQSDGDLEEEDEEGPREGPKTALEILQEQVKKKELKAVDHARVDYLPIRKKLYIVPRALHGHSDAELNRRREALEIKVRGKGCPAPLETWEQSGLPDRVLGLLRKYKLAEPFPIQRQALPAIMAGRDIIGVAKTGSGKTLAFLLPMLRHILDQEASFPLGEGEGPIGMVMAPARELAVQIHTEAKKFCRPLGLRCVAVYGGAGIGDQIGELKRGAHIVVCTPGRMIDILTMQAGKLMSLSRVSFVVMDEADRMFDMGFEPQIKMILTNIRPDRQTVLFSATFPKQVESLARKVLAFPLEILVGGRSVASDAITQYVEVREEGEEKYMRLLQLLGVWYEKGNVLIFVDTQQKCDNLFADLMRSGYPCLSLHGGMDQMDRDSTIHDFKSRARTLMVATSVAGRGLDVPELCCVINYACPNHLEDYVHRVGRTGRAGRKGTAYTFLTSDEEQYAPLLLKALTQSKQEVPPELRAMAEAFQQKVTAGTAHWAGSGFGGKGFTFEDSEQTDAQRTAALQKKQYQIEQGLVAEEGGAGGGGDSSDEEAELEEEKRKRATTPTTEGTAGGAAAVVEGVAPKIPSQAVSGSPGVGEGESGVSAGILAAVERAKALAERLKQGGTGASANVPSTTPSLPSPPGGPGASAPPLSTSDALARARALAEKFGAAPSTAAAAAGLGAGSTVTAADALKAALAIAGGVSAEKVEKKEHFFEELEINEYPQQARWKATQKDNVSQIQERTECSVITRGRYVASGQEHTLEPGERKL